MSAFSDYEFLILHNMELAQSTLTAGVWVSEDVRIESQLDEDAGDEACTSSTF